MEASVDVSSVGGVLDHGRDAERSVAQRSKDDWDWDWYLESSLAGRFHSRLGIDRLGMSAHSSTIARKHTFEYPSNKHRVLFTFRQGLWNQCEQLGNLRTGSLV